MRKYILCIYIVLSVLLPIMAQDGNATQKIIQHTEELKNAYKQNDDYSIAKSYEKLGSEYFAAKEYAKAESYFLKAKELYVKTKKKQDKNRVSRLLAQAQEAQNKIEQAISNYEDASDGENIKSKTSNTKNTILGKKQIAPSDEMPTIQTPSTAEAPKGEEFRSDKSGDGIATTKDIEKIGNSTIINSTGASVGFGADINTNDAERLKNYKNPEIQTGYLESNIQILEKEALQKPALKEELFNSYSQLADVQLKQNKLPEAIQNYSNAYQIATSTTGLVSTGNQLTNAYIVAGKFDAAIAVQEKILAKSEIKKDANLQVAQMQNLADVYVQKNENEKALEILQQSYDLAVQTNNTIQAKNSVEQMVAIYQQKGDISKSIALYKSFLDNFENIIINDSLLLDKKVLQVTEEKIKQLENEKRLKDELIKKKNIFNYFLIGASILLCLLLFFIGKSLYQIKIKNKKIELQSLRREMNPHFVFNSLNSINQFIAQNNELEANKYLSSYSNLMRSMMENSNKDFIPLSTELELLKRYLDLEQLRFSDKFEYAISVDERIDTDALQIPNMLIQPHLENAIWHGLRYKETKGLLQLNFILHENLLLIKVEDNGIGITQSKAIKTKNQQVHQSIGISNTTQRIQLLNQLYQKNIECTITELQAPNSGTVVKISYTI